MTGPLASLPRPELLVVHAAPIEGSGLDDLGAQAIGVGKAAATHGLMELMRERDRVRAVLLFGVAGAYPQRHRDDAPPARVGDLVVVSQDRFGDEGVDTPDGFLDLAAMKLGDGGPFAADPRLSRDALQQLGCASVRGATVSTCSGTEEASERVRSRCRDVDVETMEGAAVAFVCRQQEVPLLHVRAISNWTGDRARGEWNLGAAVDVVQRAVRRLLEA